MPEDVTIACPRKPDVIGVQSMIYRPDVPDDGKFVESLIDSLRFRFVDEFNGYPDRLLLSPMLAALLGEWLWTRRRRREALAEAAQVADSPSIHDEMPEGPTCPDTYLNMRVKIARGPLPLKDRYGAGVMERAFAFVRLEADVPEDDTQ